MKTKKSATPVSFPAGTMTLLPPAPNVCQECAVEHDPIQPHNQQSLYYQMAFKMTHGRWPTWTDAMSHCSEHVKKHWKAELVKRGVKLT